MGPAPAAEVGATETLHRRTSDDQPTGVVAGLRSERSRVTIVEVVVLAGVAVLPLGSGSPFYGDAYSVKLAVAIVVAGAGLIPFIGLLRAGDRAAVAAGGFLAVVWLSVAVSHHPWPTAFGAYNGFTSGLVYTLFVLVWSGGRSLGESARKALPWAALAGVGATAAMIWVQGFGVEGTLFFPVIRDRPAGLVGNPVYAGALLAGALGLMVALLRPTPGRSGPVKSEMSVDEPKRARSGRSRWGLGAHLLGLAILAGALNIAGGRQSTAIGLVVAALAAFRLDRRRRWLVAMAVVIGFGASMVATTSSQTGTASRVSAGATSGLAPRFDMWRAGAGAFTERPVLGWGPGRFFEATGPRIPESFVLHESPGTRFLDAHTIGIELLVSLGVLGLLTAGAWIMAAGWVARGPMAVGAVAFGLNLLLEPTTVLAVWALVLLGAAATPLARAPSSGRAARIGVILGGSLATVVLAASALLQISYETGSLTAAQRAGSLLPPMAEPHLLAYRARMTYFPRAGAARNAWFAEQRAAAQEAVEADPVEVDALLTRGEIEALKGRTDRALHWYLEAMYRNPQDANVLSAVEQAAIDNGQPSVARRVRAHRCRIDRESCRGDQD